jgi:hypothetical protein
MTTMVITGSGRALDVRAESSQTVRAWAEEIERMTGIAVSDQRLLCHGVELGLDTVIAQLDPLFASEIHLKVHRRPPR